MELLIHNFFEKYLSKSYTLDLIKTISKTYDKDEKVKIETSIENIDLNIETAMPYGIILNELIEEERIYKEGSKKTTRYVDFDANPNEIDDILNTLKIFSLI